MPCDFLFAARLAVGLEVILLGDLLLFHLALRFDEPVVSPFAAAKVANSSGSAKSAKKLIFADDGFQPLHIGRRIRAACRAVPQGG